ncbi:MFS transporter [Actinocorallia populi]|uniref:MFS transporter n=1 Tax=Actinocorallia populi TaxID=2079200 RepID=UPI000D08D42F|nr:MFS transporter [Actinocorallia populi]
MLFRARTGTFLTFAAAGLMTGVWVVRMPALKERFALDAGGVGVVLLVWGVAAVVAMQGLRVVISRFGSRPALRVAAPLTALSVALVALAPSHPLLLAGVALFGMAFGVTDVAMNAQASVVERAHGRPLMSGMHAGWCAGAMTGGLLGSGTAALGWSFTASLLLAGLAALPLMALLGRTYLPDPPALQDASGGRRRRLPLLVYLLGALTFLAFMTEGAIADWSGLFLHDDLHASQALAALGYPLFEAAMLCGRLFGDRLRVLLGTRALLTWAGTGTAAGMAVVLLAPGLPVALAGFFLTGLAVCTIVPTMLSLAGTAAPGRSAASVAQVGAMGYGGLLLGPVAVSAVAEASSVRAGLWPVVALSAVIAVSARFLPLREGADLAAAPAPERRPEPLAA